MVKNVDDAKLCVSNQRTGFEQGFFRSELALIGLSELNLSFSQSLALMGRGQDLEELFFHAPIDSFKSMFRGQQIQRWQTLRREVVQGQETFLRHHQWLCQRANSGQSVMLVTWGHRVFPPQLQALEEGPGWLWLWGRSELLKDPSIALVGARNASPLALALAHDYSANLAAAGLSIVSGLALGVDGSSHEGALAASGDTVAVLGSGLDNIYPHQHQHLGARILDGGGILVSPWPLFKQAMPYHFPARNRIVSGLSLGVMLVEAAAKSGSLITARAALEQGKEVFVVAASASNQRALGGLNLVREGAVLVYDPRQVLAELVPQLCEISDAKLDETASNQGQTATQESLPKHLQEVLNVFGDDPLAIDILCQQLARPYHDLAGQLTELTLLGYLTEEQQGFTRVR